MAAISVDTVILGLGVGGMKHLSMPGRANDGGGASVGGQRVVPGSSMIGRYGRCWG